jgi:hypothetical protein
MPRLKTYDLRRVILIIGGFEISGYDDDGAIEYENGAPIGEMTSGADGHATFSRNNDGTLTATISVKETSKSYRDLAGLLEAQEAQGEILPLPYMMRDLNNGDEVKAQYATFLERPVSSKGKGAGSRDFKIGLPNAARTQKHGTAITV